MKTRNHNQNFLTRLAVLSSKLQHILSHKTALHDADFARLDELEPLLSTIADDRERLLIGKTPGHVLAASPTTKRAELGNILVVAPTRGGKGLLAEAQLLT